MKMDELTKSWVDREIYKCNVLLKERDLRDVQKIGVKAYLKSLKEEGKQDAK